MRSFRKLILRLFTRTSSLIMLIESSVYLRNKFNFFRTLVRLLFNVFQILLYSLSRLSSDIVRMCHRLNRELSSLNAENVQHQEDQHDDNVLTSVESTSYRMNAASNEFEHLKADLRNKLLKKSHLWFEEYWATQFIEDRLTEKYDLNNVETKKFLLKADDFVKLIRHHWISDINVFFNERQRVQLATILLLATFIGSRSHALLFLTYRDLDLYVDRDGKTRAHILKLGVQLIKIKSRQKRKRP